MEHPTLLRLWDVARQTTDELNGMARRNEIHADDRTFNRALKYGPKCVFGSLGLNFEWPISKESYGSTPENSLMFAATGGDGVHFSFVLTEGQLSESSPITMTIPCIGWPDNIIVGGDLHEFLCLGMFRGYFMMEQLGYYPQKYATIYSSHDLRLDTENADPDLAHDPGASWLLQRLIQGMDLRPWGDVRARLNQLQREYSPLLMWEGGDSGDSTLEF